MRRPPADLDHVGEARNGHEGRRRVTSPDGAPGVELVREPMGFPPSRAYQQALFEAGIPATAFTTADIRADYERLHARRIQRA